MVERRGDLTEEGGGRESWEKKMGERLFSERYEVDKGFSLPFLFLNLLLRGYILRLFYF